MDLGVVIRREKKVYSFDLSLKPIERAPTPACCSGEFHQHFTSSFYE